MPLSGKNSQLRNLEAISAILALSRTGSFRAAMRETGQGFRTLSNSVALFEQQLGFPIFRRTANGLIPTTEGKAVLTEIALVEDNLNRLERLATQSLSATPSEFVIGVSEGIATFWLMPRIPAFEAANPTVRLRLDTSDAVADPRNVAADVYIQFHDTVVQTMKRAKIGTIHLILCASEAYIAQHGNPRSIAELAEHRFILQVGSSISHAVFLEDKLKQSLPYSRMTTLTSSSGNYLTIERGAGIGFLPTFVLAATSTIKPVRIGLHHSVDFWLAYHEGGRKNPRLNETLEWLLRQFHPKTNPWFRHEFIDMNTIEHMIATGEVPPLDNAYRFGVRG